MTLEAVQFRRAESEDYTAILRLQRANYFDNLSVEERKEGFLSAEFTEEQVAAMAKDLGIMIAVCADQLAGYLLRLSKRIQPRIAGVGKNAGVVRSSRV